MSTVDPNSVDNEAPIDPGFKQRSYTEKDFEGKYKDNTINALIPSIKIIWN
jgi:hypothetical protein